MALLIYTKIINSSISSTSAGIPLMPIHAQHYRQGWLTEAAAGVPESRRAKTSPVP
jgi:hypothetical protein